MATEKWTGFQNRGTVLTTELNALANGTKSDPGTVIDNDANLDRFGVLQLLVDYVSAPSDEGTIDAYALPALDGTTYPDGGSTVDPAVELWVGSFTVQNTTAAQVLQTSLFRLPPCKVKFMLVNRTGNNFPATGSTATLLTCNREVG